MIICNTGPLIALERAGLLHLPGTLYGPVLISDVVEREFLAGQPSENSFTASKQAGLIQVCILSDLPDPSLAGLLDVGEASVIQLARKLNVNQVLIDERKGRKVAPDQPQRPMGSGRTVYRRKQQQQL